MKYNLIPFNTNEFTWVPATNSFVAELSTFGNSARYLYSRLYDDAMDVGFNLVSNRTGVKKLFTLYKDTVDEDGTLQMSEFRSACGIKVIVLND